MDAIEPDTLYDERGDVGWIRPILQGDVFEDVILPGFDDEPTLVQIVAHPCAMRSGPHLAQRITVAPVEPFQVVSGSGWNGNLRVMPLPELFDGEHFATRFVDVTAASTALLGRSNRIATLSHRGIHVLQQRLIKHYTRLDVELEVLRRQSAAVLTEAELQEDWLDQVLAEPDLLDDAAIDAEVTVFDEWLSSGSPSRRELLENDVNHADVRRQSRAAALDRVANRPGREA